MNQFNITSRGELLEYTRADEVIRLDLTWSLHLRVYADAELQSGKRSISGPERIEILREVVAYLRQQTHIPVEVVGESSLGDQITYSPASLAHVLRSSDWMTRNSAIHELRTCGEAAVPLWYKVLADESDSLCVSSAFGLLLEHAGLRAWDHREILFRLSESAPTSAERVSALDNVLQLLRREAPHVVALLAQR